MNSPFRIFPSSGYINSQFQIVTSLKNLNIQFFLNGKKEKEAMADVDNPTIISKLEKAGKYKAVCYIDGKEFFQTIDVMDALRLGTSELKAAYTFDTTHYSFFLMKDRLLLLNERTNTILTENGLSPTDIRKVDQETFLFITKIGSYTENITNYGLFSTLTLNIKDELLNRFKEIYINESNNIIWLYHILSKAVICYTIIDCTFREMYNIKNIDNFKLNKQSTKILLCNSYTIQVLDVKTHLSKMIVKSETNAVDDEGIVYKLTDDKINFSGYDHHLITTGKHLHFNAQRFYYIGNAFCNKIEFDDFPDSELPYEFDDELLINIDKNIPYHVINLNEVEVIRTHFSCIEYFPTINGAFQYVSTLVKEITRIEFSIDELGNWVTSWNCIRSNKYSIIYQTTVLETEVIKPIETLTLVEYKYLSLIVKGATFQKVLRGSRSKLCPLSALLSIIGINGTECAYLITEFDSTYSVFNLKDFSVPILSRVSIHNLNYLRDHLNIWYSKGKKNHYNDASYLKGYNLITGNFFDLNEKTAQHSLFKDASDFIFHKDFILSSNKILIHPRTGSIRYSAFESIISFSETLNKVITRRENNLYLLTYDADSKTYSNQVIHIEQDIYLESYLSPDGDFLVLKKQTNEYVIYDIEKGVEIKFFSGKFLAFSKEGNLIIENNSSRQAKIYDPLTFEDITPPNYHYYKFLSPDGKLYAQVAQKVRYYDKVVGKEIDLKIYTELKNRLDNPPDITSLQDYELQRARIQNNRSEYFKQNSAKLSQIGITNSSKVSTSNLVKIDKFTEIGIVGTDKVVEIHFPVDLAFYNYAAFSYDNQFFGYVGKPSSNGLINLFKINYDESSKKLEVIDSYLSRYPRYASWVCGLSKTGYFATYDSTPDTYIIKCNSQIFNFKVTEQELKENITKKAAHLYHSFREWNEIYGKNFLCFSPNGRYLALSEQGYEPLTLGGYGHQESNALHIAITESGKIIDSFIGHGDKIKESSSSKLAFVAFSEDEKRIMSMSTDGVVIIRNLKLNS